MIVKLHAGLVHVGMNLPFFVPESLVETKLAALGLRNFKWFDRSKPADLSTLTVNPTSDPSYTDDWTRWLTADYDGPPREFEEKKIWSWLVIQRK